MTTAAHLWAIGYDDLARAEQVRTARRPAAYSATTRHPAGRNARALPNPLLVHLG